MGIPKARTKGLEGHLTSGLVGPQADVSDEIAWESDLDKERG